jgi:hypothetical protein
MAPVVPHGSGAQQDLRHRGPMGWGCLQSMDLAWSWGLWPNGQGSHWGVDLVVPHGAGAQEGLRGTELGSGAAQGAGIPSGVDSVAELGSGTARG